MTSWSVPRGCSTSPGIGSSHGVFRATARAKPALRRLSPKKWSWGESNPRPSRGHRLRYDHSPLSASWRLDGGVRWRDACHRSFPGVSGLSRRQRSLPAVLHRFCCQAAVDRPRQPRRAARCVTSRPGSGCESDTGIGIAVYLGAPFEESGQLWSHRSASVLGVETSQPRDGSDLNVSDALVKDPRDRSGATAMTFATFPDVGGVGQRVDDPGSRDRWARRRRRRGLAPSPGIDDPTDPLWAMGLVLDTGPLFAADAVATATHPGFARVG